VDQKWTSAEMGIREGRIFNAGESDEIGGKALEGSGKAVDRLFMEIKAMHTRTMDRKLYPAYAAFGVPPLPRPAKLPPALRIPEPRVSSRPAPAATKAEFADMDAMLSAEPTLGVFQGLRLALLFNAGIALTGILVWECWALLAG
jgi:hypothetical protein